MYSLTGIKKPTQSEFILFSLVPEYQGEPDEISIQKCREAAREVLLFHSDKIKQRCMRAFVKWLTLWYQSDQWTSHSGRHLSVFHSFGRPPWPLYVRVTTLTWCCYIFNNKVNIYIVYCRKWFLDKLKPEGICIKRLLVYSLHVDICT